MTTKEKTVTSPDVVYNHKGETCTKVSPECGYYQMEDHYYHVRSYGDILHVTSFGGGTINTLEVIYVGESERLRPITKDQFENELTNAILDLGLGRYLTKAN